MDGSLFTQMLEGRTDIEVNEIIQELVDEELVDNVSESPITDWMIDSFFDLNDASLNDDVIESPIAEPLENDPFDDNALKRKFSRYLID
jgi:hypothetical protein